MSVVSPVLLAHVLRAQSSTRTKASLLAGSCGETVCDSAQLIELHVQREGANAPLQVEGRMCALLPRGGLP